MRTAIKYSLTALLALSALTAFSVQAQVPAPGPGAVAFPGNSAPAPTSSLPSAAPSALPTPTPVAAAASSGVSGGGNVPGNVQDVINKIKEPSQDVTLGDLNAAREAIAKLDVLIDIEKRLTDLASIRKEREDKNMTAVAAALPPVAYAPPPTIGGAAADYGLPDGKASAPVSAINVVKSVDKTGPEKVDVQKIIGTEGRYIAYIKADGSDKPFKQGDKLSDGSVVTSISRSGVTLSKNKKSSTFQVKDIEKVFGAR